MKIKEILPYMNVSVFSVNFVIDNNYRITRYREFWPEDLRDFIDQYSDYNLVSIQTDREGLLSLTVKRE